jgi:hypothetical protein
MAIKCYVKTKKLYAAAAPTHYVELKRYRLKTTELSTDAAPTYYIEFFKYGYRRSVDIWRLNDWKLSIS